MRLKYSYYLMIYLLLHNCSDSTSVKQLPELVNHVSFTINYTNSSKHDYKLESFASTYYGAFYNSDSNSTTCTITGFPESVPYSVLMSFAGSDSGVYPFKGLLSTNMLSIVMSTNYLDRYDSFAGQTKITKFGDIGQEVEGNFEGSFQKTQIPDIDTVSISGTFKFWRGKNK